MDGLAATDSAYDFGDVVLLKETDRRDSRGAGFETRTKILQRNAAESEHRDFVPAGVAERLDAGGLWGRHILFFEDRGEDCEVCVLFACSFYLGGGVAGDPDGYAGGGARATRA